MSDPTGLLGLFDKFIVERGASAILRERILLVNDQLADSQRRCAVLEVENQTLNAQLEAARLEIDEIRRLQNEADKQRQQQIAGADVLPADRLRLLRTICFHEDLQAIELARICGLGAQVVEWHIDALRSRRLIDARFTAGSSWSGERPSATYSISSKGRDALAERGMLDPE